MTDPGHAGSNGPPTVCAVCGAPRAAAEASDLGWSTSVEGDRVRAVCPRCTRYHVRAIEAKLPEEWW